MLIRHNKKEHRVKDILSIGTIGHNHLLSAAQKAFHLAGERGSSGDAATLVSTGIRLFGMAWAEFPLNVPLATELVRLSERFPSDALTDRGVRLARRLARTDTVNGSQEPGVLFGQGDYEGMSRFFEANTDSQSLLFMVGQAYQLQSLLSNWDWLEAYLSKIVRPIDPEISELLLGEVYLAGGKYELAVPALEELVRLFGVRGWGLRLAAARALAGDTMGSLELLGTILADNAMHTSALLYMDSLAFPADRSARFEGKCVVSIYSFNKSEELSQTLDSLLGSDLGKAVGDISVRVLINGSQDDSLAVAEKAQARFNGIMDVVALPVNIGAPAARNWLLDCAARDGARWIVFLDDDVLVPSDWLSGLAAGVESFPEAGVWGCRVGDARSHSLTQHGDGFLLDPDDAARMQKRIVLQEPCVESLIPPLLRYRRYAASVTGCCHLFEVESLARSKGFDLIFSPSQFDDLDLDLRRLVQGKPAAYLGDVHITHLRESTHFLKLSDAATMQSKMHRAILEERHAPCLDALLKVQSTYVEADLEAKRTRLREAGLLPIGP